MPLAHDHEYRYLVEYRDGIDLFYCVVCLEYRAVKRDEQVAVRELDAAPHAAPHDLLTRVVLGERPDEEQQGAG